MGMYPSAALLYGIDLGIEEEVGRPDWLTEELEEEYGSPCEVLDHLLRHIEGIGHDTYGNSHTGYTGIALCTQYIGATAYKATPVGIDRLSATVKDDAILKAAWAVLYPHQLVPDAGWFMVLSYG